MHYCVWRQSCSDSHLLCWGHNIPLSTSSTTTGPSVESLTFVLFVWHCPPWCCWSALSQHNFHCPMGLCSTHDVLRWVCVCCVVHFLSCWVVQFLWRSLLSVLKTQGRPRNSSDVCSIVPHQGLHDLWDTLSVCSAAPLQYHYVPQNYSH